MPRLTLLLVLWGSPAVFASCNELSELSWMLGDWSADTPHSIVQEHWQAIAPTVFTGAGTTRAKKSGKTSSETLLLTLMQGRVFYLAKVAHNPLPVPFALVACEDGHARFENPEHDFPKTLDYRRIRADEMQVMVNADLPGSFTLVFHRIP